MRCFPTRAWCRRRTASSTAPRCAVAPTTRARSSASPPAAISRSSTASTASDGENPEGALIVGADGDLYGTTLQGGGGNRGTIFTHLHQRHLTALYSFPSLGAFNSQGLAINATGANPRAGLLLAADGNYYGTAYQGGTDGYGTVFRMTPAGAVTVVHAFTGPSFGGAFPLSAVMQDAAGNLYGTTRVRRLPEPGLGVAHQPIGGSSACCTASPADFSTVTSPTPALLVQGNEHLRRDHSADPRRAWARSSSSTWAAMACCRSNFQCRRQTLPFGGIRHADLVVAHGSSLHGRRARGPSTVGHIGHAFGDAAYGRNL